MRVIYILILVVLLGLSLSSADEGHHHDMMMGEETQEEASVGICPVMGGAASKEYSYIYEGKPYYFCCPNCIEEFKKDPQKYISKIKEIKLEAFQYGFFPDPVVVKRGDIVRFDITSRDVSHGVYIKEYGINVSVKKDEYKKIEFRVDKEGSFDIVCSVYCGSGHSNMRGKLIVEE